MLTSLSTGSRQFLKVTTRIDLLELEICPEVMGNHRRQSEQSRLELGLRRNRGFSRANDHCPFVATTEPEVRNIKPKKYSSTLSFSIRFARIRHGS
jgi:hypothetical protein